MIKPSDIFLLENRFLYTKRAKYNMHTGHCDGEWMEMLPPLNPVVTITEALIAFEATEDEASDAQTYTVVGSNLYSVFRILPPVGYELSLNGTAYLDSLAVNPVDGALSITVYVRLKAGNVGNYDGNIRHSTTGFSENVAVEGVVYPAITTINYGLLYNWYAATDVRGIASAGWGVPSKAELEILYTYIDPLYDDNYQGSGTGRSEIAGGDLKETGLEYWDSPNTEASNLYNFNGRGAGFRQSSGFWYIKQDHGTFSKTQYDATYAWFSYIAHNIERLQVYAVAKTEGWSVRLLRSTPYDSLTDGVLADGDAAFPYTGNDGKIYRTVKIGTQVWLADSLAETKWSDGSWIQGYDGGTYTPITDANWAALTTAALCAYGDDTTNI